MTQLLLVVLGVAAAVGPGPDVRVKLPAPARTGAMTVEAALWQRRSVRSFVDSALSLAEVGQVLWAANGINRPERSGRTTPSAGACYPLEVYLCAGLVAGLEPGLYRYRPDGHELVLLSAGDRRPALARAARGQASVGSAPAALVYTADFGRTTGRYGRRGRERYVAIDLGHSGENVYLQCAALSLGTVAVGAFDDSLLTAWLGSPKSEEPLYIMPFGRPLVR